MNLEMFVVALPCIVLALALHEFGHAAMADKLGDPTPRAQGRVTLNPLAHLDPMGTMFILMTLLAGFGFGWGKPVLTNPMYFKNYRMGLLQVAFAGPLMNICLVMLALGMTFVLYQSGAHPARPVMLIMAYWIQINMVLAIFNLIPIPPLDGGNILASLLPGQLGERYRYFGPYGMLILLGLMFFGLLGVIIRTALQFNILIIGELLGRDYVRWLFSAFM
jgi:Zn-dependent protease